MLKKELIGWLDILWEDTALYETKEELERGYPLFEKITDLLEEFDGKKVKIVIEEIEQNL